MRTQAALRYRKKRIVHSLCGICFWFFCASNEAVLGAILLAIGFLALEFLYSVNKLSRSEIYRYASSGSILLAMLFQSHDITSSAVVKLSDCVITICSFIRAIYSYWTADPRTKEHDGQAQPDLNMNNPGKKVTWTCWLNSIIV